MSKFQLNSGKEIYASECFRFENFDDDFNCSRKYKVIEPWQKLEVHDFYHPKYLDSGDYNGSLTNVSNREILLKEFGHLNGIYEIYGSYSYKSLVIQLDILNSNQELQEMIFALENYASLSDENASRLEEEAKENSWDSTCHDFLKSLEKKFNYNFEYLNCMFISLLFGKCEEITNTFWNFEYCEAYFPVDEMISKLNRKKFLKIFKEVFRNDFEGKAELIRGKNEKNS